MSKKKDRTEPRLFIATRRYAKESASDTAVDPNATMSGSSRQKRLEDTVQELTDTAWKALRTGIDRVKKEMAEVASGVEQLEVSFSIELNAETNVLVLKTGGKGSLGVKIVWKKR